MISFQIEKGIPIPPIPEYRARSGRPPKYNWADLEIGDSVLVPSQAVARTAGNYAAVHRLVFTIAKQTRGKRGWRVWRVA